MTNVKLSEQQQAKYKKSVFTESDDRKIVEYMKNNAGSDRTPWFSLSKMLGYSGDTIRRRYNRILQPGDKKVTGRYTNEVSREIMEFIFEENENALTHHYAYSDPLWVNLGTKLNRRPFSLYVHWEEVIRPQILMYENGVDHVDFRPILIDVFEEKKITFRKEINWIEMAKDKRFKGTTPYYLTKIHSTLVASVKKTNPGIEDGDVTTEDLRQYLDSNISHKPSKHHTQRRLIQDYETIKNSL